MNENIQPEEILKRYGAIYVKDALSKDTAKFLTSVLLLSSEINPKGDPQVPNAKSVISHDLLTDSILEQLWPCIEVAANEELIPTYSYSRLYSNGDILEEHVDRPACEVSVTIQLGRSHHYSWPIYMGGQRFDLAEGDAVIYSGCNIPHWRNECCGPEGYYSGQIFLHYVRANGPYAAEAGDRRWQRHPFKRFRTKLMDEK